MDVSGGSGSKRSRKEAEEPAAAPAPLHPGAVNALILSCKSPRALLDVATSHAGAFNDVNAATLLHRLSMAPSLDASEDAMLALTLQHVARVFRASASRGGCTARTISSAAFAIGRLSNRLGGDSGGGSDAPPPASLSGPGIAAALEALTTAAHASIARCDAAALSAMLWSWGCLKWPWKQEQRGAQTVDLCVAAATAALSMGGVELSNSVWGLARSQVAVAGRGGHPASGFEDGAAAVAAAAPSTKSSSTPAPAAKDADAVDAIGASAAVSAAGSALLEALARAVVRAADAGKVLNAQGLSTCAWGLLSRMHLGGGGGTSALRAAVRRSVALASQPQLASPSFSIQDLSLLAQGLSKDAVLDAIASTSASNAWELPFWNALIAAVDGRLRTWSPAASGGAKAGAHRVMPVTAAIPPVSLTTLLQSFTPLQQALPPPASGRCAELCALLAERALDCVEALGAQDLGVAAMALVKGGSLLAPAAAADADAAAAKAPPPCDAAALLAQFASRAAEVASRMSWRSLAAVDLLLRLLLRRIGSAAMASFTTKSVSEAFDALGARALITADELSSISDDAATSPGSLLVACRPWEGAAAGGECGDRTAEQQSGGGILLVGDDPGGAVGHALSSSRSVRRFGGGVTHWRRFESDRGGRLEGGGSTLPPAASKHAPAAVSSAAAAAPSPPRPAPLLFSAAAIRFPSSSVDAFAFVAAAVSMRLPPGAPVWIFGAANEGLGSFVGSRGGSGIVELSRGRLCDGRLVRAGEDGSIVLAATVSAAPVPTASKRNHGEAASMGSMGESSFLASWAQDTSLSFAAAPAPFVETSPSLPWRVFPGLFAGGLLDVMTEGLLAAILSFHRLPSRHDSDDDGAVLPANARVLDFACGSGALSAGLLAAAPHLRVTCLDADALAIEACRLNVPSARRVILSDGWPAASLPAHSAGTGPARAAPPAPTSSGQAPLPLSAAEADESAPAAATQRTPLRAGGKKLHLIVSNPPVHRGQPDDLRVLTTLLAGAPGRLRAGGSLWVVAQAHIPVGALAHSTTGGSAFVRSEARPFEGGRFVAWRFCTS